MYLQYTIDDGGIFDCEVQSGKRREMLATSFSFDPVAKFRGKKARNFHVAFFFENSKSQLLRFFFYVLFQKHIILYVNLSYRVAIEEKFDLYFASTLPSARFL